MHLEPGGLVGDQGVRRRVRLVEAVLGELLHQVEDLRRGARVDAALGRAGLELGALLRHFLGLLLAHRAAQQVGAAQRIAGQDLGDLHHLFLVHDDAVGGRQHRLQRRVRETHLGHAVLAVHPFAVHPAAQRAGAEQRGQRDDVLEGVGPGALEQLAHAARFELEHGDGVAAREQFVARLVGERQGGDVERRLAGGGAAGVDRLHRPVDDRQRAQAEEVELHQADRLDVVLVELGDRVAPPAMAVVFGEQRAEVLQRAGRDHHAAGVLAGVAGQVLELQGEVDEVADLVLGLVALLDLGDQVAVLLLRALAAADHVVQRQRVRGLQRDQLGQVVDEAVGQAEHAPGVAQHRLRGHGAVGDDLADPVAAVLARDVVDHLVAPVHAEVDVEVGHRHAFRVEEALEQQVVGQRVEVGDAQRPGHQRAGAGAAAGADRDAVLLRPVDEVGDDQEVAREAHLDDDVELGLQAGFVVFACLAGRQLCPFEAPGQAVARLAADPAVEGLVVRHREGRQVVGAQPQFEVAAGGQREAVVERVRYVGEQRRHRVRRLQELLGAVVARAARIVEHPAAGDAHAGLVGVEALGIEEAHVVAGDHRDPAARGDVQREGVEGVLALPSGAHQLQVQALAEAALEVGYGRFREVVAAPGEQLPGVRLRPGQREQAGVGLQPRRPRDHAIHAVAFHPRAGEQFRQAEVAGLVAAEQGEPAGRARALREQHVGARDRLDAGLLRLLVELHQREQVVLVGDRHRRQPARRAGRHEFRDADRGVDQRVLAVQVQVGVAGGHGITAGTVRRVGRPPTPGKA